MTILIDHFPINQPTGSHDYGPANVPQGATTYVLRLARNTTNTPTFWPNAATQVQATIFLSTDGGVTFPVIAGSMTAVGGTLIGPSGQQLAESSFTATVPVPAAAGLRAKATVIVTNGPLISQVTVEAS